MFLYSINLLNNSTVRRMVKKLESRTDVLGAFLPEINKEKTIKQVMERIRLSYQPAYKYLNELADRGLLKRRIDAKMHFYSLNLQSDEVKKHIELAEIKRRQAFLEKNEFRELLGRLAGKLSDNLSPYLSSIVLFGSTARGKQTRLSDIDIFIAVSSDDDKKTKALIKEAESVCVSLGYEFNKTISPITVSVSEFRNMIRKKQDFIKNLLKDGLVLYGESAYYTEIIKSMEELKWIE